MTLGPRQGSVDEEEPSVYQQIIHAGNRKRRRSDPETKDVFTDSEKNEIYVVGVVVVDVVTCDPVELRRGLSIMADTEFVAMVSGIVDVSKKA